MPDDIKTQLELVQIARRLNEALQTGYYTPTTLKQMSQAELDNLVMAVTLVT